MASPVELVELDLEELGEHFGRLRVHTPDSERGMARSMRLYGQLSPVVVCLRERRYELTTELEEAWIVYALVREDGVPQVEVAELLGRHKTWVCRRLALVEKLSEEAKEELRVGLLTPTAARHVARLPQGNQKEFLQLIHS